MGSLISLALFVTRKQLNFILGSMESAVKKWILLCFINYCTWVHCLSPHTHTHTHLHTHTMAITQTHKHTHTQTNGQIQLQFPGLHCCVHFSLNCTQLRTGIKREEGSVQESEEKRKSGKERRKRHYSNHKISALTHRQRHPHTHTHSEIN